MDTTATEKLIYALRRAEERATACGMCVGKCQRIILLEAELAEARRDTERLDWYEDNYYNGDFRRAAIDESMGCGKP